MEICFSDPKGLKHTKNVHSYQIAKKNRTQLYSILGGIIVPSNKKLKDW